MFGVNMLVTAPIVLIAPRISVPVNVAFVENVLRPVNRIPSAFLKKVSLAPILTLLRANQAPPMNPNSSSCSSLYDG